MYAIILVLLLIKAITGSILPLHRAIAEEHEPNALINRAHSSCDLKNPQPEDSICGLKGRLHLRSKPPFHDFADPQVVSSVKECRNFCAHRATPNKRRKNLFTGKYRDDKCHGFSYNEETNLCMLYPFFPTQNFTQSSASKDTFYQFQCYDCPQMCPTIGPANLLDNSGFELSLQYVGPWYLRGAAELVQIGKGATKTNQVFCPAGRKCNTKQYRRLCIDQTYKFYLNMKFQSSRSSSALAPSKILLEVGDLAQVVYVDWLKEFKNPSYPFTMTGTFLANQFVTGYAFKANDEATGIQVSVIPAEEQPEEAPNASSAGVYVDNFSIIPAATTFETQGDSLLRNGGFETGKMAPWDFLSFLVDDYGRPGKRNITSPGLTGNYAFERDRSDSTGFWLIHPTVHLVKGKMYLISFDFTTSSEMGVGRDFIPGAAVSYPNSNATQDWGSYIFDFPRERTPFQRVFKALDDVAEIRVTIYPSPEACFAKPNVCKTVIDNIDLRELADGTS